MAEIRHLENRHYVIFFCWGWSDLDKISQTGAEWHVDCGDMINIETRCRIPIWRTFGRIAWHVIPEPPATLIIVNLYSAIARVCDHILNALNIEGAATWQIQCHDFRATCHIAGCCHRANSTACHPRATITLQGAVTSWIHRHFSRATSYIAGCSHLAKSMSWSRHIAGCNNSIRHIENRLSPYFILLFLKMQFGLWRAAAFVSSPIHLFYIS